MNNFINITIVTIKEIIQDPKLSIAVVCISALAVLVSKFIDWFINSIRIRHEKQSFYFQKTCLLIDNGVELFLRVMFNKLLISYKLNPLETWRNNIFILHKDILSIESLLVIYAPQEIIEAFAEFRSYIFGLKDELAAEKWSEFYKKGSECLEKIRKKLGKALDANFKDFLNQLKSVTPQEKAENLIEKELKSKLESDLKVKN